MVTALMPCLAKDNDRLSPGWDDGFSLKAIAIEDGGEEFGQGVVFQGIEVQGRSLPTVSG